MKHWLDTASVTVAFAMLAVIVGAIAICLGLQPEMRQTYHAVWWTFGFCVCIALIGALSMVMQIRANLQQFSNRKVLDSLISRGHGILEKLKDSKEDSSCDEFDESICDWNKFAEAFLQARMPTYLAHFRSNAALDFAVGYPGSRCRSSKIVALACRLHRLGEILLKT
jgi:hypothetical protein